MHLPVHKRHWNYLFDNLSRSSNSYFVSLTSFHCRAIDELYDTCEVDFSIEECNEVIETLKRCTRDFQTVSIVNFFSVFIELEVGEKDSSYH